MYLFYIDESGTRDPQTEGMKPDGSTFSKDHIYVVTAISLFERKWYGYETTLNNAKKRLIDDVYRATGQHFQLADLEIKSNVVRRPSLRAKHPFFNFITPAQGQGLLDLFYKQLDHNLMRIFAVVVDKRYLASYLDSTKLHKKAYELLLERIQCFLDEFHHKHLGIIISDDMGVPMNRSLAMKHSWFQTARTTSGVMLKNIVELPLFVRSELSNGVQLADLCAYNVYRTFRYEDPDYEYFKRMLPRFYRSQRTDPEKLDGLKIFPSNSPLVELAERIAKETARVR